MPTKRQHTGYLASGRPSSSSRSSAIRYRLRSEIEDNP